MGILIPRQQIDRRNSENWAIALSALVVRLSASSSSIWLT